MESQPLPQSEVKSTISKKNLFRKKTLIILSILEACFIATFFLLRAKTHSFNLGYIIDDVFLDKLAERELYRTLLRISLAFCVSFGMGIILHFLKVLPIRKNNKVPSQKILLLNYFSQSYLPFSFLFRKLLNSMQGSQKSQYFKKKSLLIKILGQQNQGCIMTLYSVANRA